MKNYTSNYSKKYYYLIFITLMFFYIYSPPINIPLMPIRIVALISYIVLLLCYKKEVNNLFTLKITYNTIFIFFGALLLSFFIDLFSAGMFRYSYDLLLFLIEVFPISVFLSIFALKTLNMSLDDFYTSIIVVGMLQALVVFIMIIYPDLRLYTFETLLRYGEESKIIALLGERSYGFADGYLYSFPVFQGIVLMLIILFIIKKSYLYILSIPFILISIVVNARIGLVAIPVIFFVGIFLNFFKIKLISVGKFAVILIVFIVLTNFLLSFLLNINVDFINIKGIYEWNYAAIEDVTNFLQGKGSGTTIGELQRMVYIPSGLSLLFGEGMYIFSNPAYPLSSDVGYVINLYYGGIIYSLLVYGGVLMIFYKALQYNKDWMHAILLVSIVVLLFIVQIKGNIFSVSEAFKGSMLICIFTIMKQLLSY
ncbi:hypothetical protein ES705_26174 [subsurface metagenome]